MARDRVQAGAGLKVDLDSGKKSALPREAKVKEVTAGGPAAIAGVASGDVIVSVDDRPIESGKDLWEIVRMKPPGAVVRLRVKRDGTEREVSVALGKRPPG